MTAPWLGQGMPEDASWFSKQIESLQRQINELRAASSLAASSVGAGGITSADFDGQLDPPQAGTAGWGLSGKNGNAIFNNIVLRGGIIGNDALTNPIVAAISENGASGYALTTTQTERVNCAFTTPAGFTNALVFATVNDTALNASGSADRLFAHIELTVSQFGTQPSSTAPNSTNASANASVAGVVTGLSAGDAVTVRSKPSTGTNSWAANAANTTWINAMILFFR